MQLAAQAGHLEVVKYLCGLGKQNLHVLKNKKGRSPLSEAKKGGQTAVLEYFKTVDMGSENSTGPSAQTSRSGSNRNLLWWKK
jgi:hypothetical protein